MLESEETMDHKLAICLVSGGMDSCVTAAIAHEENDELAFLHVSYGQRTEKRERQSFEGSQDHYNVKSRLVISLEQLARIGEIITDRQCNPGHSRKSFRARHSFELRSSFRNASPARRSGELG
jgi:7-cyano-7-deazaguanine synthase in queuosine biosynthesis